MHDAKQMSAEAAQALAAPGPDARFRDRLRQGVLTIQRCRSCGSRIFYPRLICPSCGSLDLDEVESRGRGTVYSTSVVRRRPDRGGDYNIVIVELDEGPRLMSQILDLSPTEVTIGLRVEAAIETADGEAAVFFYPAQEADDGA